jgi:hypothetical protein
MHRPSLIKLALFGTAAVALLGLGFALGARRGSTEGGGSAASPNNVLGTWQCMRSVVRSDAHLQRMFTFDVRPDGVWVDRTTTDAVEGRYTYSASTGVLELSGSSGLLYTLQWTAPGEGGAAERLVELVRENTRAGEVCYRVGGSAQQAAPQPATSDVPQPRAGHDPFNKFAYPAFIEVSASTDGLEDAVFVFTLTPLDGGKPLVMRRTRQQLLTSPDASYRVPLDQTANLLLPRPGRYRVQVKAVSPTRGEKPMVLGWERQASVELEWGPNDTYLHGGKQLMVLQPE